jgi:hypothetical protein
MSLFGGCYQHLYKHIYMSVTVMVVAGVKSMNGENWQLVTDWLDGIETCPIEIESLGYFSGWKIRNHPSITWVSCKYYLGTILNYRMISRITEWFQELPNDFKNYRMISKKGDNGCCQTKTFPNTVLNYCRNHIRFFEVMALTFYCRRVVGGLRKLQSQA